MRLCKECGVKERKPGRSAQYCIECAIKVKLEKRRIVSKRYEAKTQDKRKEYRKQYDRSQLGKSKYARYRNTKKYRDYSRKRYHSMDENQRKAEYYVSNAVRDGKLVRPENCEKCGIKDWGIKRSMIEAHHYLGYEEVHWLHVQWLCTNCHKLADKGGDAQ